MLCYNRKETCLITPNVQFWQHYCSLFLFNIICETSSLIMAVTFNQLTRRTNITRKLFTWLANNQMNANHNEVLFIWKARQNKHRYKKYNNQNPHIYKKSCLFFLVFVISFNA